MSAENFDLVYDQQQPDQFQDSSNVVPKYHKQQDSGVSGPTAATSNPHYLTFDGDFGSSPKAAFKLSNQNALLSLMSQDDLEGIRNQIHQRINKIDEVKDEDEDQEQ